MSYIINCTEEGIRRYPMHSHKNYEIMLYLKGEGYLKTENEKIPFCRGTVIIVPPGVRHGSVSDDGFLNISIEGGFDSYLHITEATHLSDNESREGETLARMIYENRYGKSAYISSLCSALACFITQRLKVEQSVERAVQEIIMELSQVALDSQADPTVILLKSGYSEDYIRSCFKKITGKTPNELLTDIRIKHACFLIDVYHEELPLSEISERCGYLDYVYFSKRFKSVVGISPREYRKKASTPSA